MKRPWLGLAWLASLSCCSSLRMLVYGSASACLPPSDPSGVVACAGVLSEMPCGSGPSSALLGFGRFAGRRVVSLLCVWSAAGACQELVHVHLPYYPFFLRCSRHWRGLCRSAGTLRCRYLSCVQRFLTWRSVGCRIRPRSGPLGCSGGTGGVCRGTRMLLCGLPLVQSSGAY